jgi:hypothetical protein
VDTTLFYNMNDLPLPDESDCSFSKTVIIYGEGFNFVELGYYDFEQGQWLLFCKSLFLLKCWCYIPKPDIHFIDKDFQLKEPKGYKSMFF